jgi:O-methyltransferase
MVRSARRWLQRRGHGTALPAPLRPPARLVRDLIATRHLAYRADGVATAHYCPFLEDAEFDSCYWEMSRGWMPEADVRWRMWLLTMLAQQCQHLSGDFAEFGTWRGGCAYMVLSRTRPVAGRRFFLFDTFSGIPADRLTEREQEQGFAGRLRDTSVEHVDRLLARWRPRYQICPGDIFETLDTVEVHQLSFVHIDLNATAASRFALEFAYARMVRGGVIVFDDYGWTGYEDQRVMIDEFFAELPEKAIALPTGQAWMTKH